MYLSDKITLSAEETELLGMSLAKKISEDTSLPHFIALYGDLGVGKTAFIRGFCSFAAPQAKVKSPTFTLVNEYKGASLPVFHFDMYRIEDEDSLYSIGFDDYPDRGICLIEWTENIEFALPEEYIKVTITKNNIEIPCSRQVIIELVGKDNL
ncbi:MAG: tRNA (adenosine(37)-N6)-threonylcarbamoyltransferase complex ATPase subunit type 1 TsaE [Clostridia bacterium]|nr:tRNA (adenosine(37)-N6)-threonylcarbamoyltransferase complex ATPase subunit type 1 TsaE [Clostridia bacterium]